MDQIEAMNKTCTEAASTELDHADDNDVRDDDHYTTKPTCTIDQIKSGSSAVATRPQLKIEFLEAEWFIYRNRLL